MGDFFRLFDLSGLSLDLLRSFLRVVDAANLTKAAQGNVPKQSQFPRQIKELENFFGVALIRRVGRRIEIPDEGHRLATGNGDPPPSGPLMSFLNGLHQKINFLGIS